MKALLKYEKGIKKFKLATIDIPEPGDEEVLVEIIFAGICGTDVHIYHDTYADNPPMVVGHEFCGKIVARGKKATRYREGEIVVAETNQYYCGVCELCKSGRFCLCNERLALGQKTNGVFAEYAVIKESNLHVIKEGIPLKAAALAEPLSCVVHAVMERSTVNAGDTVLISGPGPIGLLTALVVLKQGGKVIVSGTDSDKERLELASELGVSRAVNIEKENLQEIIQSETKGQGVDVVFECSGIGAAVASGVTALKKRGIFTQIGLLGKAAAVDIDSLCYKEIDYKGCLSKTNWSWNRTIRLLESGDLPLERIVSHTYPIERWEEAMTTAETKSGLKVLFEVKKI